MRLLRIVPLILLFSALGLNANAQCKGFAKRTCLPLLGNYTHDGNYHAAILVEGEEAELYKTFYANMDYRVAILGEDKIPGVEFRVLDSSRNVLYSSKDAEDSNVWDFRLESSQQLMLVIVVPRESPQGQIPKSGCVSIMFGFRVR